MVLSNYLLNNKNAGHLEENHEHYEEISLMKETTDADLEKVKSKLVKKRVEFNFKHLKRNSNSELTSVKMGVNKRKRCKQSIFAKTNDVRANDELLN